MKFSIVHEYNVPAEKLWECNFNPDAEQSVARATNLQEFRVLESKEVGNMTVRKVRVLPNIELPGAIKALVGHSIGYTEEDKIPKVGMAYDFKAVPDTLADKISIAGTFKVEPVGGGRCKRTISGEVLVKIFGVGRIFEKFVCDELEKSYAQVAKEQERWIKAKGQV